ncbi:unnamed protein product, partial [Didymodactylos carnosus]
MQPKCVHCAGNHYSNAVKCPIVKQYRAELTKKLLSVNCTATTEINNLLYNPANFPPLHPSQKVSIAGTNNMLRTKLDELVNNMSKMNEALDKIVAKNEKVEQFMHDKIRSDKIIA